MTKSVEELEREFARQVGRFIDLAMAEGHSLQEAKAMARDVVARCAAILQSRVHRRLSTGKVWSVASWGRPAGHLAIIGRRP